MSTKTGNVTPIRKDPRNPLWALGTIVDWKTPRSSLAWRVENVFAPGKVSAIVAYPDGGKSLLAEWVALSVALGRNVFPGTWATKKCPVVYYDSETGPLAEERLTRMANVMGTALDDVDLTFMHGEDPFDDEMLETLRAGAMHVGAGLLVIDTYGSTLPGDVEHNSADFSLWLKTLGKLSRETGVTVIVIMHSIKGTRDAGLANVAGHHSAGGALQSVVELRKDQATGSIEVVCVRHPRAPWAPFNVKWRDRTDPPSSGRFSGARLDGVAWGLEPEVVAPSAVQAGLGGRPQVTAARLEAQQARDAAARRIVAHLQKEPNQADTRKEILFQTGKGRAGVDALAALKEAGIVVEWMRGEYRLNPDPPPKAVQRFTLGSPANTAREGF